MSDQALPIYMVNVERLPKLGMVIKLALRDIDQAKKEALIKHLDLVSIAELSAQLRFRHWAKDGVQIEGEFKSELQTQCPVSLQGVDQSLDGEFHAKFVPTTSKLAKPQLNDDGEMILDFDADDIADIYEGNQLDAWMILLEYLALEIDPFARAQNAEVDPSFGPESEPILAENDKPSPFAVLQSLKK